MLSFVLATLMLLRLNGQYVPLEDARHHSPPTSSRFLWTYRNVLQSIISLRPTNFMLARALMYASSYPPLYNLKLGELWSRFFARLQWLMHFQKAISGGIYATTILLCYN